MGKKRKNEDNKDDNEYDPAPKHLQVKHIKNQEKRLIIILENAQLESVKVRIGNSSICQLSSFSRHYILKSFLICVF